MPDYSAAAAFFSNMVNFAPGYFLRAGIAS
jgi:hypothetical protein